MYSLRHDGDAGGAWQTPHIGAVVDSSVCNTAMSVGVCSERLSRFGLTPGVALVEKALPISILGSCKRICIGLRDFPASRVPPHFAATPGEITATAKPVNRRTPIKASVRFQRRQRGDTGGVKYTAGFRSHVSDAHAIPM